MHENRSFTLQNKEEILNAILGTESLEERWILLEESGVVPSAFLSSISQISREYQYLLALLFLLDQDHVLEGWEEATLEDLKGLARSLETVEDLFSIEGGLIGYQRLISKLLSESLDERGAVSPPKPYSIEKETDEVRKSIYYALTHSEAMCELYPIGGAADRLNLSDPNTRKRLPAAKLGFLNKSLLEGLVDDVKAREYLVYKLFGKQVRTPIGLMTSSETHNHNHILDLCKEAKWFQRGEGLFALFSQPLVPCISEGGKWIVSKPCSLEMKPGGHGMIWLLAQQQNVFRYFKQLGKSKILLRQINNPIAGIDNGLLSFMGYGLLHDKSFGFSSCPRRTGAKEGMNVIVENESGRFLTNLEYCDFEKYGVDNWDSGYADYPANTNILFADCVRIEKALEVCPFPGKILNFSSKGNGVVSARLETMMQNIADVIPSEESFLTLGSRNKTIASAKKAYVEGQGIFETPLGAFYTYLENAHDLLTNYCGFTLPPFPDPKQFENEGPSFVFTYHPSLGPLYSVIAQKIQRGTFSQGAALRLEIADLFIEDLELSGSLTITADQCMGHLENGLLTYSEQTGKCILSDVIVPGEVSIHLQGNSAFIAHNMTLPDGLKITVPNGMIARAHQGPFGVSIQYMPKKSLSGVTYRYDETYTIQLSFAKLFEEISD